MRFLATVTLMAVICNFAAAWDCKDPWPVELCLNQDGSYQVPHSSGPIHNCQGVQAKGKCCPKGTVRSDKTINLGLTKSCTDAHF
ncbi:hypothetical protein PGTUg99_012380 [Puccinia graminis f. sp. tritici]|uniref:Secreted protein n=1 Tax=Puccinia graminis f. sp. tritici TaxID=56615 RepID=A0A5B0N9S5_PUCGR|nr:hypothetical protein PGTUg99_012380 [Puccinia graminis f. sp. tritici]